AFVFRQTGLVPAPQVNAPGQTLYQPDMTAVPRSVLARSIRDGGTPRGGCSTLAPPITHAEMVPTVGSVDLSGPFPPPYAVVARCPAICPPASCSGPTSGAPGGAARTGRAAE